MKKFFLALIFLSVSVTLGQQQGKIDFRTVDIKYLNREQLMEFQRWRADQFRLMKSAGYQSEIKSVVIQGNKIHSIIYNTGAISAPGVTGNVLDLVWQGLGYGYEFGPLVASKVPKANAGDSVSIVIDGFGGATGNQADGDFQPNSNLKWGWLPKPGYSAPGQNDVATWGARTSDLRLRPKSWPESWYNPILGEYIYPSFLGGNSSVPDEEVYYIVDDSTDAEFITSYQPMPGNPTHGGLGINLEVRTMQFANPLAEDIIFLVYTAENDLRSKDLPKVFFGMFGDPHVGGYLDFGDDAASFIPSRAIGIPAVDNLLTIDGKLTSQFSRNIVYSWDPDGKSQVATLTPGYFGYKFLESPNNSTDQIDNDDDGITDEDPFNDKGTFIDGINVPLTQGIADVVKYTAVYGAPKARWSGDENGNWNKETDDVGIDGIFGTGDYGEGDGIPSQAFYSDDNGNGRYDIGEPLSNTELPGYAWAGSEPNFGFRDVNESDQIGLRSFWSLPFGGTNRPSNDQLMYDKMSSDLTDTTALQYLYTTSTANKGDYIFLYGSGPFDMVPGHRERFSIALLMGSDLKDLLLNSETAQLVMAASYRFAQPPPKPRVVAEAGDGRVTLYWDSDAESATDPFTSKKDFEGYKIYRSRDFTFSDVFSITDANGNPFLGKALYDPKGRKTAQWHRPWTSAEKARYPGGYQPVEFRGRYIKYYMGEPEDSSGLRHEYVDSTVTNGVTYYYAVVSFDHGDDSLQLPPSECQAIIQQNAVTQAFKYDANTVGVVPNAIGQGLLSPKITIQNGATLSHTGGVATGPIQIKVLNEASLTKASYGISFGKAKVGADTVLAYNIRRNTIFVEQVTGNENLYVNLQYRNFVSTSLRVFDGNDTLSPLVNSSAIIVDSAGGRIRANALGVLLKTKTYTIAYQYYPVVHSNVYASGDANPVFDGIRLYVTNDALSFDTLRSSFSPTRPSGLAGTIINPTVGAVKYAPLDVKIQFLRSTSDTDAQGNYVSPVDSFGTNNPNTKTVRAPFKVVNMSDTTTLQALVVDLGKTGRWDIGDDIIILTPPPYRVLANNTMMEIAIKKSNPNASPTVPIGTSFTAKMKKPFDERDLFSLETSAITYNPQLADSLLSSVIVVPNPYVIASQFELPSYRPDLRGDRVIQFRNLPRECTIRIYTMTGELVQTLHKNDNSNYINWDVLSFESARIGYGVYIYHVETPTGGTKIGRLGIIK